MIKRARLETASSFSNREILFRAAAGRFDWAIGSIIHNVPDRRKGFVGGMPVGRVELDFQK